MQQTLLALSPYVEFMLLLCTIFPNPCLLYPESQKEKPAKLLSQQEKLALKAGKTQSNSTNQASGSSKSSTTEQKTSSNEAKAKESHLRPFTPPTQTGSKIHDEDGNSPSSQACTSGDVTPNSEGVRVTDRKRYHAPPGAPFAP